MKFCDLRCEHATYHGAENMTPGCHTEQILYCKKFERFVRKNQECLEK